MQSEQQQRIMGYFIEEAKDHLNTLEQGLLNLQSTLEDPEMVNELFRAAHSVKGGAAMLGIDSIHQTSHRLEDCFKILKEHPVKVDHEIESLLLTCLDTLQELLEQLQSPFGLTEDKSREIMSGVEPVFTELGNRLTQLVAATGGVITPESQDTWIAPEAVAPASTPVRAEEESALQLIFQSDVPRQLRDMLQLFKQADTLDRRQQLQEICSGLKRTGEQFDLRNWCELLESARLAIASPENTYHTLAPIVIREIKQGQELVLAGRSSEIAISPALQELLPIAAVSEDLSFDAMFAGAEEGGLDLSAIADGNVSQAPAASVSDLDFHKATGDRPGPEVGVAELNSLADLFEGDVPDLDITWEQEEILGSTTDEILSSLDLDAASDFSDDFADLLFEESADSNSSDEDDLSGFLQAAERRAEPLTTGDLDFDLGDDDSADIFGDLLEPKPAAASNGAGEPDEDLGDLFAEIDAVDLEAETPKTVGQPAPELAALGSLFGEMPVDDAELMTDLNEAEPSIFDEADDLLQGDFGGASGDELSDLGFEDDLLFAEAQSSEVTEAAEPQADLDFSGDLFDEPGDTDDFLDLGLAETEAIAPEEEALGNLLSNRTSPQRTDQLGAAESSELANLFGEPSFDESSEESELTDNLFDTGAEAVDELEEVSLDAFANLSDDAASPAEHQALIGMEKPEAEETEAALEASDDFSALEWDTSTEGLDFSTDETEEPEAENPEAFADTSAETTDFALTSPELAWDALESEHEAADAAIDEALGIASFDLGEDMWDMPLEQGTESTEPTASTNEPSAEAINEPSEAIALNEWDLNLDAATESPANLEADLFDESDVGSVAPSTGEDWDNFFESSSEGDRSNVASDEIADFFGAGAAETEREATSLGDFGSTMDFLSEETDQPAAEVSASLEEDLWASEESPAEAATTATEDLELGLGNDDLSAFDLSSETSTEEAPGLDFTTTDESGDSFEMSLESQPEALNLDLESSFDEPSDLDFGLEGLTEEPAPAATIDFDLGSEPSDSLALGTETAEPESLDFNLGTETAAIADEFDLGLDAAEEPGALDFGLDTEASDDLGLDFGTTEPATDELDFGPEATEASELSFDLEGSEDFGLELAETSEEAEALDFDLELEPAAETTADATDELDFGLDLEDESDGLSFETAATDELDFDLDTEGSTDEFDLSLDATEEPESLDFGLDTEASEDFGLELAETSEETNALDFDLELEPAAETTADATDELDFGLDTEDESDGLSFETAATDELDFGLDTEEASVLDDDLGDLFGTEATDAEEGELSATLDFGAETTADATDELDFGLDLEDESDGLSFEAAATDELDFGLDTEGSTDEFDLGLDATEEPESLDFGLDTEASDDLGLDFGTTEPATDELDFGLDLEDESDGLSFETAATDELDFGLAAEDESGGLSFEAAAVTDELDFGLDTEGSTDEFDLGLDATEEPAALDFGLDTEASDDLGLDFGTTEPATDELDFGPEATEASELSFDLEGSEDFGLELAETSEETNALDFDLELEPAAETTADATDELDFGLDLEDESDGLSFETAATDELDFGLDTEEASVLDDDLGDLFGTEATDAEEGEWSATLDFGLDEEPVATANDFSLDVAETSNDLDFGLDEADSDLAADLFGVDEAAAFEDDLFGPESADVTEVGAGLDFDEDLLAIADEVPTSFEGEQAAIAATETIDPEEVHELESLLAEESGLPLETSSRQVFDELAELLYEEAIALPETTALSTSFEIESEIELDNEFADLEKLLEDADNTLGPSTKSVRGPAPTLSRRSRGMVEQTMRVPVKHLDNLNNLVGELVVNRNSLEQDQERLRQFLDNLLYQVQQLSDVGQRMRDLYERSLLESSLLSSRRTHQMAPTSHKKGDSNPFHATGENFDALEMDRFTSFHTLSQEMIELIVRVREASSDIEYIVDETDQVTRSFRQVTTQLQEGLNRSRMVPFAQIADRLPRAVRDIAMKCGKQAELVIEGRDTLIDKMILEQLYDPMTHLVNNAITHGIEAPDVRKASGKAPTGRITVRAFHQGNQTVISVSDDGAGIPVDRVKAKAVERGLVTPVEAKQMSRLDVYDLLFHPGFSIRDKADDFAGRGIGMDVVRTSLNEIRGAINTDSTLGRGTSFTIRLPLTLSISKALCCISNHARIAFPMDGVEDMLDLPKDRVQTNPEGQPCILWRDTMLPFRPLTELLRHNRFLGRGSVYGGHQDDDIISIVVLRSAGTFIALQVDQVLGEQEIVIKQLEGPVPKPAGVAGATVLGDGRIMPIADVLELIDLALGRARRDVGGTLWEEGDQVPVEPPVVKTEPTVLIVDDSITVRELLSMTFNKSGYRVEQARDGQEAWEKLRSGLPCDLVFCDIEMPRMDGLELLSRMQKDPALSRLPIAMLTSRGADRHRQMAVQLGARGYFTKPYLEEALLDAAQRMLKGEVLVGSK